MVESTFWENFTALCKSHGKRPRPLLLELGIGSSTIGKWQHGTMPRTSNLIKIANYFNISVDDLLASPKTTYLISDNVQKIPNDILISIAHYLRCDISYLFDITVDYKPSEKEEDLKNLSNAVILSHIYSILNKCVNKENSVYRALQIQISRVILYNLRQMGITVEMLLKMPKANEHQLQYLAWGGIVEEAHKRGFTFSEVMTIWEEFPQIGSPECLFTR